MLGKKQVETLVLPSSCIVTTLITAPEAHQRRECDSLLVLSQICEHVTSLFPERNIHSATQREGFGVSALSTSAYEPVMRTLICDTFISMDIE